MSSDCKKKVSSVQETKIANFLQWRKVSGSGARSLYPGDIYSDEWLGECKTHIQYEKIAFHKSHWLKICEEANSKFLSPALFVDDGSIRLPYQTWVMFFNRFDVSAQPAGEGIKCNKSTIVISPDKLNKFVVYEVDSTKHVCITSLQNFKKLLAGG